MERECWESVVLCVQQLIMSVVRQHLAAKVIMTGTKEKKSAMTKRIERQNQDEAAVRQMCQQNMA